MSLYKTMKSFTVAIAMLAMVASRTDKKASIPSLATASSFINAFTIPAGEITQENELNTTPCGFAQSVSAVEELIVLVSVSGDEYSIASLINDTPIDSTTAEWTFETFETAPNTQDHQESHFSSSEEVEVSWDLFILSLVELVSLATVYIKLIKPRHKKKWLKRYKRVVATVQAICPGQNTKKTMFCAVGAAVVNWMYARCAPLIDYVNALVSETPDEIYELNVTPFDFIPNNVDAYLAIPTAPDADIFALVYNCLWMAFIPSLAVICVIQVLQMTKNKIRRRLAATTIQALWRGNSVRNAIQQKCTAVTKIQAQIRCRQAQAAFAKQLQAVQKIQAFIRMVQARDDFKCNLALKRHAATIIQAYVRCQQARVAFVKRLSGIRRLQATYRGGSTRKMLQRNKAATFIQALVRGVQIRANIKCYLAAATTIQAYVRGRLARVAFAKQLAGIRRLQAIYRKVSVRAFLFRVINAFPSLSCDYSRLIILFRQLERERKKWTGQTGLKSRQGTLDFPAFSLEDGERATDPSRKNKKRGACESTTKREQKPTKRKHYTGKPRFRKGAYGELCRMQQDVALVFAEKWSLALAVTRRRRIQTEAVQADVTGR